VVLGYSAEAIKAELVDFPLTLVLNPAYRDGQSTSVRAGLAAVGPEASGALFLPCDQPWVDADLINHLIASHQASPEAIVLPAFQGQRGSPVLFPRSLFPELENLQGDQGGRQMLPAHEDRIVEVPLATGLPLKDVDTQEDLRDLLPGHDQPEK
jgi:molybdenum cofactor cytidylyltransferase